MIFSYARLNDKVPAEVSITVVLIKVLLFACTTLQHRTLEMWIALLLKSLVLLLKKCLNIKNLNW